MIKPCSQTKCGFLQAGMGCRKCQECNAEPFKTEQDSCVSCWNCEHDEGVLRWDDRKAKIASKTANKKMVKSVNQLINFQDDTEESDELLIETDDEILTIRRIGK